MIENPERDTTELISLLNQLAPCIRAMGYGSLSADGAFLCTVRASMVKAFEFSLHTQTHDQDPFFLSATLRGICEDLIVLSFLESLEDRDEIVLALFEVELADELTRQQEFFQTNRPWQPVLHPGEDQHRSALQSLNRIARKHSWERGRFPKIRKMAESEGLLPLYNFMYSATSKWVHCTPHILLRMGWLEAKNPNELGVDTHWRFSTQNFAGYYLDFNRTYSGYLLLLLCRKFIAQFEDSEMVHGLLDSMLEQLEKVLRWPELVTYEEMNIKAPGVIFRVLLRVVGESQPELLSGLKGETARGNSNQES